MSNPLLDAAETHYCVPRLKFVDGKLNQLWMPADSAKDKPEWRVVDSETTETQSQPE